MSIRFRRASTRILLHGIVALCGQTLEMQSGICYDYHVYACRFILVHRKGEKHMKMEKTINGAELTLALSGRLDTTTAPELEAELKASLEGITNLALDFEGLEYLSSAGLRVLLAAQKQMNKQGGMVIRHVNETIAEIFDVTGFSDILTIE